MELHGAPWRNSGVAGARAPSMLCIRSRIVDPSSKSPCVYTRVFNMTRHFLIVATGVNDLESGSSCLARALQCCVREVILEEFLSPPISSTLKGRDVDAPDAVNSSLHP